MTGTLLAAGAAIFDLIGKQYAQTKLNPKEDKPVLGGAVLLTRHHNYGAALNAFEDKKELVLAASCTIFGALAAVFFIERRKPVKDELRQFALACLLAGAGSNIADRIGRGYVVDYIRLPFYKKIVWNIGDFLILAGSLMLAIRELFRKDAGI